MKSLKGFKSPYYNYIFNYATGFFMRWGKTLEEDPEYSPFGPEILDIEISTKCSNGCSFCYKSNTDSGSYMTLETFKNIFKTFPKLLTQIAFGIGDIDASPDMWQIMDYCRENKVVPNITINGERMTEEYYKLLADKCGAVAVSHYNDDSCFSAVDSLSNLGMKQVNIHKLLSNETYEDCLELMKKTKSDKRLKGLNAIVFLWLKPKGSRNCFTQLDNMEKYRKLIDYAFTNDISIGFDSCSAPFFLEAVKDRGNYKQLEQMAEPCESTLFSFYINVEGMGFPCSFTEDTVGYDGIDLKNIKDFVKDVWNHKETLKFRNKVIGKKDCNDCRVCQTFKLGVCNEN